jgi:peptide methionine sulfoxide reductase msrA/msrB
MENKKAIVACGCFWGVQHHYKIAEGVLSSKVGYIGGSVDNPTYEQVCSKSTGHIEAIEVEYDPEKTNYKTLLQLFFEIHDFEQTNGQGPDIGPQYLSAIFYLNNEQKKIAETMIAELNNRGYEVATTLKQATTFYDAEDYHQDYYGKTGKQPYCHLRRPIFKSDK